MQQQKSEYSASSNKEVGHRTSPLAWLLFTLALLIIGWFVWKALHQKGITPEEQLGALRESSLPVRTSSQEQTTELDEMKKTSTPVTKNDAQRLKDLESLQQ